mgnify:CR=1 FL=1
MYSTASAHTIYVNEVSQATTATTASTLTEIVLGAGRTAVPAYGNYLNGYIAFFGIYSGDITSNAQWANLKTYMNTTYGFTL